jgi:hypothetical protein
VGKYGLSGKERSKWDCSTLSGIRWRRRACLRYLYASSDCGICCSACGNLPRRPPPFGPVLPRGGDAAATRRGLPRGTVWARIGDDRSGPRRRVRLRVRRGGTGSARPRARASMHARRQCAAVRGSAVRQRNARQLGRTYDFSHCGWRGTQQRNFPKFRVSYTPNSDPEPNMSRAVVPTICAAFSCRARHCAT